MNEDLWYVLITHIAVLVLLLLFRRRAALKNRNKSVFNILIVLDIINFIVSISALFNAFGTLHATDGFVAAFCSFCIGMLFLAIGIVAWLIEILQKKKTTFKN